MNANLEENIQLSGQNMTHRFGFRSENPTFGEWEKIIRWNEVIHTSVRSAVTFPMRTVFHWEAKTFMPKNSA